MPKSWQDFVDEMLSDPETREAYEKARVRFAGMMPMAPATEGPIIERNRWAAFTDDELERIETLFEFAERGDQLRDEVTAELVRRRQA